ncbi:Ig-like domain-containing protein [Haloplanus pelagicus]|jgi:hypothetical protein|uniref:Ig-like domain-containing protein n=1 Tax=Haloplanus pelagicus TaxID=2949995 RepID=UPI00203F008D|nr:Ig-like domain-containing protein [Haloplanus sp. HW8-1]
MRFRDDRRAAALQVGAILLLGFLVIGLALYQSTVVPSQNEAVEFDHNQQVQESLQQVRNGILQTAAAERTSPTTVPLGTRYPTRIVAVNPPPSSGRLATDSGGVVTLVDATAVNDETADFWNGTNRSYATQRLTYDADYSVYQAAPRTVYDDTVLYNDFGSRRRAATDQRLLEGNLIYVVALDGSLSRSGTRATSVSPTPISASDRTVAVNGSDIAIEVTTDLSEDEWERLLQDQYESNGGRIDGNASGVTVSGGTLRVDLVSNRTYRLRMAKVGVGTGVTDTVEQYLTVVDGADSVTAGGTRRIVLEVRDGYNNPVSGVPVEVDVSGTGAGIRPGQGVSDGSGKVVFEYDAPDSISGSSRTDELNFTFDTPADRPDFSGEEPESVRINVTVVSLSGGGNNGQSFYYPDSFKDDDGTVETDEDPSIPPDVAEGDISSFSNLQSDGGGAANLASGGGEQLAVGVATTGVPNASAYELGISASGDVNKVTVVIVDENGDPIQSENLGNFDGSPMTLNSDAEEYVRNNDVLYTVYEQRSGKGNINVDVEYQRLRTA